MADYLNIAGRVRTTASDGVAMEAQEVKDLNQNKSQQEINADVQTELGDRYTKEETYSKEQVNDLITTPDANYVNVVATNATTAVTDILPATGEANTIYRVGNWNGTQYDPTMYALFAWNGSAYVCLAVRSFVGEVYDVSVNHPDGQGNPTPYADLDAALGTDGANIPADIRRGGMRIQFIQGTVQSSDNKYVQYRLMADEWSVDTDDWAFCGNEVLVDNPEYINVKTDADGKILWAIKADGGIYYGAGVPQQVIDYIEEKLAELSLDEYEDIVAFLSDYLGSDTTLKAMIDGINAQIATKVDKVEDKSLIDAEYASSQSAIENPEFIEIKTDSEDKIIEAITTDGRKQVNIPIDTPSSSIESDNNPEWMQVVTDSEGRILEGTKKDGKKSFPAGVEGYVTEEYLEGRLQGLTLDCSDISEYYTKNIKEKNNISNIGKFSDLKLFFFSDVHGSQNNVKRIFELANTLGITGLDCIINGGDIVSVNRTEGLAWYNNLVDGCNVPVLAVPGNHDSWENAATWQWSTKKDVYDTVIAKVASSVPGIVQPDDASTDGLCYYYKDFGTIRIVCITAMGNSEHYYDTAQDTWFREVLDDARTTFHYYKVVSHKLVSYTLQEGDTITATVTYDSILSDTETYYNAEGSIYAVPMSVIVVNHCPFKDGVAKRIQSNKLNSWLNYADGGNGFTKGFVFDGLAVTDSAVAAVNDYIDNGGAFICWLTGHTHLDNLLLNNVYENQFMINITSANYDKKPDGVTTNTPLDSNYDAFDYIGIDLRSGYIKNYRIGWCNDGSMRKRESWCFDFVNKEIISEN